MQFLKKLGIDWYLPAMMLAVLLAWLAPGIGATGGPLHSEVITKGGMTLAFFIYGLTLSFEALKAGALHWRLHAAVQVGTFLLFPLLAILIDRGGAAWLAPEIRFGFIYLCVVPSTISTSVAFTRIAGGNVAAAVFNATLSSLLGIVLTPLWLEGLTGAIGAGGDFGAAVRDLAKSIALPIAVGQVCRLGLAAWAGRHRARLQAIDRWVILFLIYASFCDSFRGNVWAGRGALMLVTMTGLSLGLFAVAMVAMAALARSLGFNHADRMTLLFCGSKKSLAQGVLMARVILASHPAGGMVLLPLMIYHALQLIIGGVLAQRWGRAAEAHPASA